MTRRRILNNKQITEAIRLKQKGFSKIKLAVHFNVSPTAIWENVFRPTMNVRQVYLIRLQKRKLVRCSICEMTLTKNLTNEYGNISLNYQVGDKCVCCYLEERGHKYKDMLEF